MPSNRGKAGNTASDITRRTYYEMRDAPPDPTKPLSASFGHLVEERCSLCDKTGQSPLFFMSQPC